MVTITCYAVYSYLKCSDLTIMYEVGSFLSSHFSIYMDGYQFSKKFKAGIWDGTYKFYKRGKFLTGLLPKVIKLLQKSGIPFSIQGYELNDVSGIESSLLEPMGPIQLRDYQVQAVKRALKFQRGVLNLATNAGKTAVAAGIMRALGIPKTVFIVPSQLLLHQASEDFHQYLGITCGKMGDSEFDIKQQVTVATYQTMFNKNKSIDVIRWKQTLQLLIADEVHGLSGNEYFKCVESIFADYRFGLSGTPFYGSELDNLKITGLLGPSLYTVKNDDLIEREVSVKPHICVLRYNTSPRVVKKCKSLTYSRALIENSDRNVVIANIAKKLVLTGRQTVIMVNHVEHAEAIHKFIPEAVLAHSRSGNRQEALQRLQSGEVFCCICTAIFGTGVSVDHIEGLVMACGGKSPVVVLQRLGRALRKSKEKEKSLWVFDFMDTFHRYCKEHSEARKLIYKSHAQALYTEDISQTPVVSFTGVV